MGGKVHRTGVVRELGHFGGLCRVPATVLPLAQYLLGDRHLIEAHQRDSCAPSADPRGQHPEQGCSVAFLFPGSSVCRLLVAAVCGLDVWGGTPAPLFSVQGGDSILDLEASSPCPCHVLWKPEWKQVREQVGPWGPVLQGRALVNAGRLWAGV